MDTANYVMTYATKAPQRDSVGPVKIFNLQVRYVYITVYCRRDIRECSSIYCLKCNILYYNPIITILA